MKIQKNQNNVKQKKTQIIENRRKSSKESDEKSSSLTLKQEKLFSSISNQLATPKTISQHIITFSSFDWMKMQNQIHDQTPIENVVVVQNNLININVTHQRRRKRKKINVVKLTIMKSGNSTNINVVRVNEAKRSCQLNSKYAQAT